MNKVVLMGRLTRDPEVRYSQGEAPMAIARYTLAVNRRTKKEEADFISCITFGKSAEFAEKYLKKGSKIAIGGHIQTGSYTNKDGQKVYTTDVIVDEHEFAESKGTGGADQTTGSVQSNSKIPQTNDIMNIPDNIDEELPWN